MEGGAQAVGHGETLVDGTKNVASGVQAHTQSGAQFAKDQTMNGA